MLQSRGIHPSRTQRLHRLFISTKGAVILEKEIGTAESEIVLALHVGKVLVSLIKVLRPAKGNRVPGRQLAIPRQSQQLSVKRGSEILVPVQRGAHGVFPERLRK